MRPRVTPINLPWRGVVLVVQAAQHARCGSRVIVLHEAVGNAARLKLFPVEALDEEAPGIAVHVEFDQLQALEWQVANVHGVASTAGSR